MNRVHFWPVLPEVGILNFVSEEEDDVPHVSPIFRDIGTHGVRTAASAVQARARHACAIKAANIDHNREGHDLQSCR